MTRGERRHQEQRVKARTVYRGAVVNRMDREHITPAWVGRTVSVHWTCDCHQCRGAKLHRDRPDQRTVYIED